MLFRAYPGTFTIITNLFLSLVPLQPLLSFRDKVSNSIKLCSQP